MNLRPGMARTGADGLEEAVEVSLFGTLIVYPDGEFAVRHGLYQMGELYLAIRRRGGVKVSITVTIDGMDGEMTAVYDKFTKARLRLPNTCIESAEHVIKCTHANCNQTVQYGEGKGPQVNMSIPARSTIAQPLSWDIDEHEMDKKAFAVFPDGASRTDARRDEFSPGDGMALVYSKDPEQRPEGKWKVHAVAILLKSTNIHDPFLVVSEVFAQDNGSATQMTDTWKLSFYSSPTDFHEWYQRDMPPDEYTLWKLSAAARH